MERMRGESRLAKHPGGQRRILAFMALLGTICTAAGAQIDVNETGLNSGEAIYGQSGPVAENPEAITLVGWGAVEPHSFIDVSFLAYGIFTNVTLVNSGPITATAAGGTVDVTGENLVVDANDQSYGIYSTYGLIANSGRIDVTASGGTALAVSTHFLHANTAKASARAYGLYSEDGAIENTGDMAVTAVAGTAASTAGESQKEVSTYAWAYGFYLDLDDSYTYTYSDRHVSNSGDLLVNAVGGHAEGSVDKVNAFAWAQGINGSAQVPVTNSGRIMVSAAGGTALCTSDQRNPGYGAYAAAHARGIELYGADLNNSGIITVSATGGNSSGPHAAEATAYAQVTGILGCGNVEEEESTEFQNTGALTATAIGGVARSASAKADAYAVVYGLNFGSAMMENTGAITVTAQGGEAESGGQAQAYASAYGLNASGGTLSNSGSIAATALGGVAEGQDTRVGASAIGITTFQTVADNSGDIAVTAQADDIPASDEGIGGAFGAGIHAEASDITNSGDIVVAAHAGAAGTRYSSDAVAYGIYSFGGDVRNSGSITVTATAQDGFTSTAYGISLVGSGGLSNTGVIRATGDTAYELFVAYGTTTLLDTYNVTLDGDPNQACIGVADEGTLALNDATLTVTAVSGETLWDTEYRLFEVENGSVVDGNFAEARAVNPNTTATYHDQGTADSADDTVSLAYTPSGSSALASAAVEKQAISLTTDVVNLHMTTSMLQNILSPSTSGLLADSGSTAESLALTEAASDKSAGIFLEPYYSLVDKDANPLGYDARLWGFSAGYERFVGATLLGFHAGFGKADIDYTGAGYRGNSEEQDIVTAGFSGLTRWDPWLLSYGMTGFYGGHDYFGLTGLNLDEHETASYDSYGTATTLMVGRIFRVRSHILLPEAGLNWLWAHRQRYTTDATDPAWDTTYSAMDDHDLYAAAALRWLGTFTHDEVRVSPSAAVGVRRLLTDAEADAWQSIPGAAPALVRSEQDRTAVTLSGSLTLTEDEHALSLAYDGEYSPDFQRHNLWLRYSWLF